MAYARLEPFGEDRADLRAGIIASTVANAHRDPKKSPFKPQDFMPDYEKALDAAEERAREPAWMRTNRTFMALALAVGKK